MMMQAKQCIGMRNCSLTSACAAPDASTKMLLEAAQVLFCAHSDLGRGVVFGSHTQVHICYLCRFVYLWVLQPCWWVGGQVCCWSAERAAARMLLLGHSLVACCGKHCCFASGVALTRHLFEQMHAATLRACICASPLLPCCLVNSAVCCACFVVVRTLCVDMCRDCGACCCSVQLQLNWRLACKAVLCRTCTVVRACNGSCMVCCAASIDCM